MQALPSTQKLCCPTSVLICHTPNILFQGPSQAAPADPPAALQTTPLGTRGRTANLSHFCPSAGCKPGLQIQIYPHAVSSPSSA